MNDLIFNRNHSLAYDELAKQRCTIENTLREHNHEHYSDNPFIRNVIGCICKYDINGVPFRVNIIEESGICDKCGLPYTVDIEQRQG